MPPTENVNFQYGRPLSNAAKRYRRFGKPGLLSEKYPKVYDVGDYATTEMIGLTWDLSWVVIHRWKMSFKMFRFRCEPAIRFYTSTLFHLLRDFITSIFVWVWCEVDDRKGMQNGICTESLSNHYVTRIRWPDYLLFYPNRRMSARNIWRRIEYRPDFHESTFL